MGQEVFIEDLRKDLSDPRKVLVVVGSGVSMQATGGAACASWKGLIRHGIDQCTRTDALTEEEGEKLLEQVGDDPAQLREVAERVTEALGGPGGREFRIWLDRGIGALKIRDGAVIDAVHDLGARIATTNYDDLLSRGRRDLRDIEWTEDGAVSAFIHGDRTGILHLHGCFDRPESVIFGVRSYEALRNHERAQAIQQAISILGTLLFIGCGDGLSDPNFGPLLEWIGRNLGRTGYRHYCLCLDSERESLRQRHPDLALISYGDAYDALTPFLRRTFADRRAPAAALPLAGYCFGRSTEVRRVVRELLKDGLRTALILGAPGIGKTTIARKAIHDKAVAARFGSRRWFVRCHAANSRAEVVAAIALAAGLTVTGETERDVFALMRKEPGALVLDNLDVPLDRDRDNVEQLLADLACTESVALVVTVRGSRRPGKVPWGSRIEPQRLSDNAAREAFLAGSRQEFAEDSNLPLILRRLDGVPSEISLMASLAERYSSLETAWELWTVKHASRRFDAEAVYYELSIEALTPDARRLLSVLALFPEGVALRDLPDVFVTPDDAAYELRGRSLVVEEGKRLRMLVPLRDYVAQRYPPPAEDQQRADAYYVKLLNEAETAGTSAELERLAPEVANIEATFVRDPGMEIDAIESWLDLMETSGLGSTGPLREVLEQAIARGMTGRKVRAMIRLAEIAVKRSTPDAKNLYARAIELFPFLGSND